AVLSVQTLYQNAFLVLAMSCGAWAVCVPKKNWRAALLVGATGAIAALSLAPYWPAIRASQSWWVLQKSGFVPAWIWNRFSIALTSPAEWQLYLWLAGLIAS